MNPAHSRWFFSAVAALLCLWIAACSTHGNYRKDEAHAALLQTLRKCLAEVPLRGDRSTLFVSPCVQMDVSPLNGIDRGKLADALGPPHYCTDQTQGSFPVKDECPYAMNPQWSFYRHPEHTIGGGGPELICEAQSHQYCITVEWRRSQ
jgi:hypothetical protein